MNMGNYKRVLASAAVLGVAVVGPMAAPAQAAPGGNSGHAKSSHAKSGNAKSGNAKSSHAKSGHSKSGNASKGGPAKGHSSSGGSGAAHSNGHSSGGNGSAHSNGQANGHGNGQANGHANGHGNAGGTAAPAGPPASKGPNGDKGPKRDKGGKGGDPAGNNGTVKIETTPAGKDAPNNVPHVGCDFQIEWYGFDEGDLQSEVVFTAHAPTSDVTIGGTAPRFVDVGEDPASGAGTESGLDAVQAYHLTFSGGEPHPKQGYHVKLTIHTEGSQGADTKHKVFWVEPCEDEQPPPPGGENPPPPGGDQETPPGDTDVEGKQKTATGSETEIEVAGEQQVAEASPSADVPTSVEAGAAGSPLGTSPLSHLIVTLGGLLAALGFLLRRRTT